MRLWSVLKQAVAAWCFWFFSVCNYGSSTQPLHIPGYTPFFGWVGHSWTLQLASIFRPTPIKSLTICWSSVFLFSREFPWGPDALLGLRSQPRLLQPDRAGLFSLRPLQERDGQPEVWKHDRCLASIAVLLPAQDKGRNDQIIKKSCSITNHGRYHKLAKLKSMSKFSNHWYSEVPYSEVLALSWEMAHQDNFTYTRFELPH